MQRPLFLLLLFHAFIVHGQFKRSATVLAKDEVRQYITDKLFPQSSYEPLSFGELTEEKYTGSETTWFIQHVFTVTQVQIQDDKKITVRKQYRFVFYFDRRMRVLGSVSIT